MLRDLVSHTDKELAYCPLIPAIPVKRGLLSGRQSGSGDDGLLRAHDGE
jgi:hypothetical protein